MGALGLPVHQVVRHDVDCVDGCANLGDLLCGEGDHVTLKTGHGDGQLLVADGGFDLLQEQGVVRDFCISYQHHYPQYFGSCVRNLGVLGRYSP